MSIEPSLDPLDDDNHAESSGAYEVSEDQRTEPDPAPLPPRICRYCQHVEHDPAVDVCVECGKSLIPICIICGYDLSGLPVSGTCPECGTAIERSYRPDRLINRSIQYLEQLRSGLSFVLNAILIWILLFVLNIVGQIALKTAGSSMMTTNGLNLLTQIGTTLVSFASLYGWWKISTPDAQSLTKDMDNKPRQILRLSVIVLACTNTLSMLISFGAFGSMTPTINTVSSAIDLVLLVIWLVATVAWVTKFFAAMLYVRWLASLVPDESLASKAKRFMWLGPVLYTVGSLCIGLGPIIALVLYWNMLYYLKKHIVRIINDMDHPIAPVV